MGIVRLFFRSRRPASGPTFMQKSPNRRPNYQSFGACSRHFTSSFILTMGTKRVPSAPHQRAGASIAKQSRLRAIASIRLPCAGALTENSSHTAYMPARATENRTVEIEEVVFTFLDHESATINDVGLSRSWAALAAWKLRPLSSAL